MNPKWHFNVHPPASRAINPSNGDNFNGDSIKNPSEALIREGIQNSLDAAEIDNSKRIKIKIRIRIVNNPTKEAGLLLSSLFEPSKFHFEEALKPKSFSKLSKSDIKYLIFEDFGTKGLAGDINETRTKYAKNNAFFGFFRAEGISSKSGTLLGRRGIGKRVFIDSSEAKALIALSIRKYEPNKVLMGFTDINSHTVKDIDYDPYGCFGLKDEVEKPVMPVITTFFCCFQPSDFIIYVTLYFYFINICVSKKPPLFVFF
jgi:hypothetical protein